MKKKSKHLLHLRKKKEYTRCNANYKKQSTTRI
nr:MAG TPA: hypothetical protein [Caudoviricetes sp.]